MILVTGGAGFIGQAICKRLNFVGERVRVFDNFSRKAYYGKTVCDEVVDADIRDIDPIIKACNGVDEVIHCAYINGTKNFYERPDEVLDVGVRGIVNLLDACDTFSVPKITLISSSEVCRYKLVQPNETIPLVIPDPYNPRYSYSAGKIISEMMVLHSKLFERSIILRPFNIYGPGMEPGHVIPDIIEQFENNENPIRLIGSGEETRAFCFIDDMVDGLMIARERGEHKGIYNVGRESELSIIQLAKLIGQIFGHDPTIITGVGLREGDVPRRSPDITRLRALGYSPKVSILEGLTKCVESRTAKSVGALTSGMSFRSGTCLRSIN